MMNTTLMSVILLMIALPTHAADPLWITEDTSTDEIIAALSLPSNQDELYRDIIDIVDKHPKVAIPIHFYYNSSELKQRAKTLMLIHLSLGNLVDTFFTLQFLLKSCQV